MEELEGETDGWEGLLVALVGLMRSVEGDAQKELLLRLSTSG